MANLVSIIWAFTALLAIHTHAGCTLWMPTQLTITDQVPFNASWTNCPTPVLMQLWDETDNVVVVNYTNSLADMTFTTHGLAGKSVHVALIDALGDSARGHSFFVMVNTAILSSSSTLSVSSTASIVQNSVLSVQSIHSVQSLTSTTSTTPTTTTTTTPTSPVPTHTRSPGGKSAASIAAIAGGAASGAFSLTAIIILIFWYHQTHRKRRQSLPKDQASGAVGRAMSKTRESQAGLVGSAGQGFNPEIPSQAGSQPASTIGSQGGFGPRVGDRQIEAGRYIPGV